MRRLVLGSAVLHAAGFAGLLALERALPRPAANAVSGIEIDFLATLPATPPPAPSPAEPVATPPPPAPAAPPPPRALPAPAPRVTSAVLTAPLAPARAAHAVAPPLPSPEPSPTTATLSPPSPPPARLDLASLLRDAPTDAARFAPSAPLADHGDRGAPSDADARARAATQGYVAGLLADANPSEPSQVHAYLGAVARRMRETWRPGFYRTPDMVDALLAVPRRVTAYAQRFQSRAQAWGESGRVGEAAAPPIATDFEDRSSFSTRTTVTIVEVEQDETGRVRSIRVVRAARVREFDAAALEAVRAAFPQQNPVPLPGGRRSRFAFEVAASRDAVVPIAGFTFNETNGFFEMHYPGALHVRTRVRAMGSRPLEVPWPVPTTASR